TRASEVPMALGFPVFPAVVTRGLAAALLVACASVPALAQDRPAPRADAPRQAAAGPKIGVVDLGTVFKEYKKRAELEKRIIDAVVRAFGKENDFTLVFKVDSNPSEQQKMLAGMRAVMYYAKELDITSDIVAILNRRFEVQAPKLANDIKPVSGTGDTPPPAP